MTTLTVGTGEQFSTIAAAVNASHDGDVIDINAGTYTNDFATINTKITLEGVGGTVKVNNTGGWDLPGDKALFVTNTDVTFNHFEISGGTSSSGNGAGIRYQAGNLTVLNSYFHNNEDGILANPSATGTIAISNSEFAFNGNPAGSAGTHNIYIGDVAKVTIDNSYFHDMTNDYNQIKSRAAETIITNSRILDLSGNASYEVDIPNGGILTMKNNVIQQSATSNNPVMVETGAEGVTHAVNSVTMTGNTFLNEMDGRGILLNNVANATTSISGNSVYAYNYLALPGGMTNTTTLTSEPALNTAHTWNTGGASPPPPPPPPPLAGAPSTPDLMAASDSGSSNTDNLTNITTPTFLGTAVAGSTVKLYDGTTMVGSGAADATGHWSVTSAALASGSHMMTATDTTASGTSVPSAGLSVNIHTATVAPSTPDMTAASDNGTSSTDNSTSVTTPTFVGTAEAGAAVHLFDGSAQVGSGVADASGNWSITSSALSLGTHALSAQATDLAGNLSTVSGSLATAIVAGGSPPPPPPPPVSPPPPPAPGGETWNGSSGNDTHTGTNFGDVINGNAGRDNLFGDAGQDTINGGSGSDTINGGYDHDALTGGSGNDHFVFEWHAGQDTITDFHAHSGTPRLEHDFIDISNFNITQSTFHQWVHIEDSSAGAVVSFGDSAVTLSGVHASQLNATDFIFT